MIHQLCHHFGAVGYYPFSKTIADGLDTQAEFLNSVAIIHSHADSVEIKQTLNLIETTLGRDRDDPQCAEKDREADIDIIYRSAVLDPRSALREEPHYIRLALDMTWPKTDLSHLGLPFHLALTIVSLGEHQDLIQQNTLN